MRRLTLLVSAAAIALVGVIQVAPPMGPGPEFAVEAVIEPDVAVSNPSRWYCPWVEAGDVVDTDIMIASIPTIETSLTLLDPITNQQPTTTEFTLIGPGAAGVGVGSVMRRGESPALVEVTDGPAAAASLEWADALLVGDRCVGSVPKVWYLTGASTKTDTTTLLRFFNPFADAAEVVVDVRSEFGVDVVIDLETFDVAGRSWRTIDIGQHLPFRDELAFRVTSTSGQVIPAIIRVDERGEAMWLGTAGSDTWDFPIVTTGELDPFISVMSTGESDIVVSVDILTEEGSIINAREITIGDSEPALIPLSDLAAAPFGVRLRATSRIAAAVIAVHPVQNYEGGEGDENDPSDTTTTTVDPDGSTDDTTTTTLPPVFIRGLAGTNGIPRPSSEWIVPLDTLPGNSTTMWILNAAGVPVTFTATPLGEVDFTDHLVVGVVPPGAIFAVPVQVGIGIFGYSVEADGPVSVAWEMSGERGAVLVTGVPGE